MTDPTSKESIRIWCMEHWIAVDGLDEYPRLMPARVASSPSQEADMAGFEHEGTWVVNYHGMFCSEINSDSCRDSWRLWMVE